MNIEGFEIYDDSSSSEDSVEVEEVPYLLTIFKKEGINKINKGKHFAKLPLTCLKDPPRLANLYTVGDLTLFLKKHNYLLEFAENNNKK